MIARASRRTLVGLIVALALAPSGADAHGGAVLASAPAGPFLVTLTAAPLITAEGQAVDYTAYVDDAATGGPVVDARVQIAVGAPPAARPPVALIGGGYEAIYPTRSARARYLTEPVIVTLRSPLGVGRVAVTPHGPPTSSAPGWLLPTTVVGCAILLGISLRVRLRRRHRSAASTPSRGAR
jgi:hypothetical protein